MTETEECAIVEDGTFSIDETIESVTYHSGLDIVLVACKSKCLQVLDLASGEILSSSQLAGINENFDKISCQYAGALGRVVFCDGRAVGVRKDLSGVMLVETALQTAVDNIEDAVHVELLLSEASYLFHSLMSAELPGVDHVDEVLKELEKEIEKTRSHANLTRKSSKWTTVSLKLSQGALKTVCRGLIEEMKRHSDRRPGLASAAAVYDRVKSLLTKNDLDNQGASAVVDRTLMYSELARRETFKNWPHVNYKWASPKLLAQAGFYHTPAMTGDDRALCFTCDVCLVSWEPTDEPWSEHERHSSLCPFVKGEFTQNVSCDATFATEPAQLHGGGEGTGIVHVECISNTSSDRYIASSSIHGNIVVWDTSGRFKKHIEFNVDPWESIVAAHTGCGATSHSLEPVIVPVDMQTADDVTASNARRGVDEVDAVPMVVEPCTSSATDALTSGSTGSFQSATSDALSLPDSAHQDDNASKAEVIEVGGAWKVTLKESSAVATSVEGDIVEIPLESKTSYQQQTTVVPKRCRPSLDVLVSALCVLGPPTSRASDVMTDKADSTIRHCLVTGVAIRRHSIDVTSGGDDAAEADSEVDALNQVNQALSDDAAAEIISQDLPSGGSTSTQHPFVSYLLVHDITSLATSTNDAGGAAAKGGNNKTKPGGGGGGGGGGTKQLSSAVPGSMGGASGYHVWKPMATSSQQKLSALQNVGGLGQYMTFDMDTDDEDDQIQILDVITPPHGTASKNLPSGYGFKFSNIPPPFKYSFQPDKPQHSSTSTKSGKNDHCSVDGAHTAKASVNIQREGQVLQCLQLPNQIGTDLYVRSITPTPNGRYVLVVMAPRCLNRKLELLANNLGEFIDGDDAREAPGGCEYTHGGYLLLYRVVVVKGVVLLSPQPVLVSEQLATVYDAAIDCCILSANDIMSPQGDDDDAFLQAAAAACDDNEQSSPAGHVLVTTHGGDVKLLDICDFRTLATINPPVGEKFKSAMFCSGIDRLCCCTTDGKLRFYSVRLCTAAASDIQTSDVTTTTKVAEDATTEAANGSDAINTDGLLITRPLTHETLTSLLSLTQYENLTPRYSARGVGSCWSEIAQEQQQRRHPQHLHRHGDSNQHTRTWRLQQDANSWDEHVFELVLPRVTSVGHVDVKFTLHPMCPTAPRIHVTLLKQKISSFTNKSTKDNSAVDTIINFFKSPDGSQSAGVSTECHQIDQDSVEIICGPVDVTNYVDISGRYGVISLTSAQLLTLRCRSLLLHIKAYDVTAEQIEKNKWEQQQGQWQKQEKPPTAKTAGAGGGGVGAKVKSQDRGLPPDAHQQRLDAAARIGCDWINEISVTVRRCVKTTLPNARAQRQAMLESSAFHEQLLIIACSGAAHHDVTAASAHSSDEHAQKLALDLLMWLLAVQTCPTPRGRVTLPLVESVEAHVGSLVLGVYLHGGRSVAHLCTKLLTHSLEFLKAQPDSTAYQSFVTTLHSAMLECLRRVATARSAGALKWFFTFLNRVKVVDAGATGQLCSTLLSSIAQHYSERKTQWHSLLRTRYGLYGNPFDPILFDYDAPPNMKLHGQGLTSYANAMNNMTTLSSATDSTSSGNGTDSTTEAREILALSMNDKVANTPALSAKLHADLVSRHIYGLLEVEPLHFSIASSSDGSRVERLDVSGSGAAGVATSGVVIAGKTHEQATALADMSHKIDKMVKAVAKSTQALTKLQHENQSLEEKLAAAQAAKPTAYVAADHVLPPTPKNTPFHMTPPLTPPNEALINPGPTADDSSSKPDNTAKTSAGKSALLLHNANYLFQQMPAQALVTERSKPGGRQYVVLDFGRPVLLTDVIIPGCSDLASLSLDVWLAGEEIDGERIVLMSDPSVKSLVLNDLSPPIYCRFIKLTAGLRFGNSSARSKFPIGSYYGHSFVLPWELPQQQVESADASCSPDSDIQSADQQQLSQTQQQAQAQSQLMSQLGLYMSLQEDIQCRYSLSCNRLESLLSAVEKPTHGATHTQYYLTKPAKRSDEDARVVQVYGDCMALQLQLNIAQRAIERLQSAIGLQTTNSGIPGDNSDAPPPSRDDVMSLHTASTDRLRVLSELLLDCLVGLTYPSMPQQALTLSTNLTPTVCEDLFRNLCVHGSKRMQLSTGLFLVRMCGAQAWWGRFLGSMLQQYFSAEQLHVFPQDRLFLLLVSLGQRSLSSSRSCELLESVLMMLAKILSPLVVTTQSSSSGHRVTSGSLDLTLIGWLLLFLSKCLDHVTTIPLMSSEGQSGQKSTGGGGGGGGASACAKSDYHIQNRWDFLQGEAAMQGPKSSGKHSTSKMFRRKLQKRLMHTKQQLLDFQKTKSLMEGQEKKMLEKAKVLLKSADSCMQQLETQEELKQQLKLSKDSLLKQYSSKHFKDIMNLRKSDGEMLRRLNRDERDGGGGGSDSPRDTDSPPSGGVADVALTMARERCIPVIRGLVSLLLSMDSTCSVDLFVLVAKVMARITQLTRPVLCLNEVLTQPELERLLLLLCDSRYNTLHSSWGGPWAGHAVTCMLQDMLEGERLAPESTSGARGAGLTDDEALASTASGGASAMADAESGPSSSGADDVMSSAQAAAGGAGGASAAGASTDIKDGDVFEAENNNVSAPPGFFYDDFFIKSDDDPKPGGGHPKPGMSGWGGMGMPPPNTAFASSLPWPMSDLIPVIGPNPPLFGKTAGTKNIGSPYHDDFSKMLVGKTVLGGGGLGGATQHTDNPLYRVKDMGDFESRRVGQGVSNAIDLRLEKGLDLPAEAKLKLMTTVETMRVHNALTAPLPPVAVVSGARTPAEMTSQATTDDDQLGETAVLQSLRHMQLVQSSDMLSSCFNNLFLQLHRHRVNMDALLQMWLTLNDEVIQEENGALCFDASRAPSVPLDPSAVSCLVTALTFAADVPVRTWVLAFQVFCLVLNQKPSVTIHVMSRSSPSPPLTSMLSDSEPMTSQPCMATLLVTHPHFSDMLRKLLSSASGFNFFMTTSHHQQIGPTATKTFFHFLVRIALRSPDDVHKSFMELLLKLLHDLATLRMYGPLCSQTGPQDAQCKLIDFMLENSFEGCDVGRILALIDALTSLVQQHMLNEQRIVCHNASDHVTGGAVAANRGGGGGGGAYFSDIMGSMLRGVSNEREDKSLAGNCSRDSLIGRLLRLINALVQLPTGGAAPPTSASAPGDDDLTFADRSLMTDTNKISQAMGGETAGLMASAPPSVALSDEQKRGRATTPPLPDDDRAPGTSTAGSTSDDSARVPTSSASSLPKVKSCSHFTDVRRPQLGNGRAPAIADCVLAKRDIIMRLIESLSRCGNNVIAMELYSLIKASTSDETLGMFEPVSIGDGIFQILTSLNRYATDLTLLVDPLMQYFSPRYNYGMSGRLSEPLLCFVLKVLDCPHSIRTFMQAGGIEVVCQSLVESSRSQINTTPSMISTMMQHLAVSTRTSANSNSVSSSSGSTGSKKYELGSDGSQQKMINFAPMGTVTSSSPKAGPAEMLIGASLPHRRARSAAFSYHFHPYEMWMDLTITLPCSIVLHQVHITPHVAALATCPSAVSLEVSRDGVASLPVAAPKTTSGFTNINLELEKPEVVNAVTVRLHRPLDANSVGLSQIRLMGSAVFVDGGSGGGGGSSDEAVSSASVAWLRLLHHCLYESSDEIADEVARAAAPTPHLLATCTAFMLAPGSSGAYDRCTEQVLLRMGLQSSAMGLALIDYLLRGTSQRSVGGGGVSDLGGGMHGHRAGTASESTIDILYQLGVTQNDGTQARLRALCDWLKDCARAALQKHAANTTPVTSSSSRDVNVPRADADHVHCVAAILWYCNSNVLAFSLRALVSQELLRLLYDWSCVCESLSLKQAVDCVICSLCYIQPDYFYNLLRLSDALPTPTPLPLTDDSKDERQHLGPLTDDTKAAGNQAAAAAAAAQRHTVTSSASELPSLSDSNVTQRCGESSTMLRCQLRDLVRSTLFERARLSTLAIASQSPVALHRLIDSGLMTALCQALQTFASHEMTKYLESLTGGATTPIERMTDACKSASSSPRSAAQNDNSQAPRDDVTVTARQAADMLAFLAQIAEDACVKDWLGDTTHCAFWSVLLNVLCTSAPPQLASTGVLRSCNSIQLLTGHERSLLETETINFFKRVISCHQENQLRFANVICDVMRTTGALCATPRALSGFMRRLLLQVLLEDEKLLIGVHSHRKMTSKADAHAAITTSRHPRCGAGHKYRAVLVSLNSTCADVIRKVSDAVVGSRTDADKSSGASSGAANSDVTDLGMQVVTNMSHAAGLSAKEKRRTTGDVATPRPMSRRGQRHAPPHTSDAATSSNMVAPITHLFSCSMPHQPLPAELTFAQLLTVLRARGHLAASNFLQFKMKLKSSYIEDSPVDDDTLNDDIIPDSVLLETASMPSSLQVFARVGGLSLLAEHLNVLYPDVTRVGVLGDDIAYRTGGAGGGGGSANAGTSTMMGADWVTVESPDDLYDDIYEPLPPPSQLARDRTASAMPPTVPPHSLVAFGVFLRLPGYAELLLRERRKAQCLLRLVLGVTDDGEGGHILRSSFAGSLPTLPFTVLRSLCDSTPLTTDDGLLLRRMMLDIGVVHLLLACLSALSHHAPRHNTPNVYHDVITAAMLSSVSAVSPAPPQPRLDPRVGMPAEEKNQQYWAKGTGFGTGSTMSNWDSEQTMMRKRVEEEHVTCLLQVLASFTNPSGKVPDNFTASAAKETDVDSKSALPNGFSDLITSSCLVPAICAYLRNDSVLDMSRHIPIYRALLLLLRALAVSPSLTHLLLPLDDDMTSVSVGQLLDKMNTCVETYANRLKSNSKSKNGNSAGGSGGGGGGGAAASGGGGTGRSRQSAAATQQQEVEDSEGLALLIADIQGTAKIVRLASQRLQERNMEAQTAANVGGAVGVANSGRSLESKYMMLMEKLQFDTYEMVTEDDDGVAQFTLAHHYESNVRSAGDVNNAARARRLAQEAVTLSTSLPLSYNSTVFVRCDEERLDVMKVLITGPSDTPYANGCFEFDVYFPQDYPASPPLVNLETTGNRTVRFNPNLYNDGKVCLSVLNTWHGRPEEKWSAQTSSFLQVLVSIQSLILVSEPYFNEPGYERSRGTPSGTASSREYDANIRQATVKWAMLEMIRNPPACFKQVIQTHMWLKQQEICAQVEQWIAEMEQFTNDKRTGRAVALSLMALKRHYTQLKEEFAKMKPPTELQDDDDGDAAAAAGAGSAVDPNVNNSGAGGVTSSAAADGSSGGSLETLSSSDHVPTTTTSSSQTSDSEASVKTATDGSTGAAVLSSGVSGEGTHVKQDNSSNPVAAAITEQPLNTSNLPKPMQAPVYGHLSLSSPHHGHVTPSQQQQQVPMSNGDISEDVASMFLGPEDDGGHVTSQDAYTLHTTDDIMYL